MGGYGASSERGKSKTYFDTGGNKVRDNNAIIVAEHYIDEGKYVAFLQEKEGQKRADLSVDGQHVEVKGLSTLNPDNVEGKLKSAFKQVYADNYRYPEDTHREGKVIILSKHESNVSESYIREQMYKGFQSAMRKGYITGKVELWIKGKIYSFN